MPLFLVLLRLPFFPLSALPVRYDLLDAILDADVNRCKKLRADISMQITAILTHGEMKPDGGEQQDVKN